MGNPHNWNKLGAEGATKTNRLSLIARVYIAKLSRE